MAWLAAAICAVLAPAAQGGSFELPGGIEGDYKLTFNYGMGVRTRNPSLSLINGPIDPLVTEILPSAPGQPAQLVAFTHTGLPTSINFDDGNQFVPVSYNVKYFDGINLIGTSFSTVIGMFNVGGEISRRVGMTTPVQTVISGVLSPVFTRADLDQVLLSAIMATNPNFFFDDLAWVTEAGVINVHKVSRIAPTPGISPVGDGGQLFYDRTSYGFQTLALPTKHNIISGWDFTMPISFGMIIEGNPALAGAFGALYGEGDHRLSIGAVMTRLANLQIGFSYNFFFGDPDKNIGNSTLRANPYADRTTPPSTSSTTSEDLTQTQKSPHRCGLFY